MPRPGVVDEDVDAAPLLKDFGDGRLPLIALRGVGWNHKNVVLGQSGLGCDGLELLFAARQQSDAVGSRRTDRDGERGADAGAGAGDHDDGEFGRHVVV